MSGVKACGVTCGSMCGAGCEACRREEIYRVYVTDALYALCGFAGIRLKGRYCDLVRAEGPGNREHSGGGMGTALERLREMDIEVVR